MNESAREFVADHQQLIGVIGAVLVGGFLARRLVRELATWWQARRDAAGRACRYCQQARPDLVVYEPDRAPVPWCRDCWTLPPPIGPDPDPDHVVVGLRSPQDLPGLLELTWSLLAASGLLVVLAVLVVTA